MNSGNGAHHLFSREMGGMLRLVADEDRVRTVLIISPPLFISR